MLFAALNVLVGLALGAPDAVMEGLPPDAGARDDAGYAEGVARRPLGERVVASVDADPSAVSSDDTTYSEGTRRAGLRLAADEVRGPLPPGRDDATWPDPGRRDPVDPRSLAARR